MSTLTKKQRIKQEEAYASEMQALKALDFAVEERQIIYEIDAEKSAERTRHGLFEDAYGGPLVVSDECTRALALTRSRPHAAASNTLSARKIAALLGAPW
jgi:hypothetical protein